MKTFLKIQAIALVLLAFTLATPVRAQFYNSPPVTQSPLTISGVFYIPGATTTNIPTTLANSVYVGRDGIGFSFKMGATNAASTTNAIIILEQLANGTDVVDSHTFSLSVPQNGTTGYDYYTNMPSTTANLANSAQLRIRSIQNTNVLGIFITNAAAHIR